MKTDGKKISTRYDPGSLNSGHRVKRAHWAMFKIVAANNGLAANAALNRLIDYAIVRGWIPEYIPNPQLPLEIPTKEQEVKARMVYERP